MKRDVAIKLNKKIRNIVRSLHYFVYNEYGVKIVSGTDYKKNLPPNLDLIASNILSFL